MRSRFCPIPLSLSRCRRRPTTRAPIAPGDEPLWSESWYFDFVDAEQGIGGWVRLGLMPNQKTAWINALLCGPDMPTVAVNDFEVALPDDPSAVRTDAIELTLPPPSRCRPTASGCVAAARPTTTRRRCCAGRRGDRSR